KIELEERVWKRTHELQERIDGQERAEHALRDLSWRLLQAQDQERRRIARELHDSTGQSLAALAMILSKLREKASTDPALSSQLDESEQITRAVSDELRTTSYLLHPPLLDEMGLKAGLRWYIDGFQQRSNISVRLDMSETPEHLPTDLALMI